MHPGKKLMELRTRLRVTTREVSDASKKLAEAKGNSGFLISNAWLTQIENEPSALPSAFKLYTLSVLYRTSYADLLKLYGVDLSEIGRDQILHGLAGTSLLKIKIEEAAENVELPVRFDPHLSLEATTLVSRLVESWGTVPIALLQHIDAKKFLYGFIGLRDNFMHPLIPPGSFVQIDPLTKIRPKMWQSEYDRPIYFVDARDRYICGWCQLENNHLLLIPHSLSRANVLKYRFPQDVEIVGRVVGVAARIDQRDVEIDAVG